MDHTRLTAQMIGLALLWFLLAACSTSTPTPIQSAPITPLVPLPTDTRVPTMTPLSSLGEGEMIAFATDRDGDWEIYVMTAPGGSDADGSGLQRLTENDADDWSPAWSPDGTQIAFVSNRDGNDEIYLMTVPGVSDADGDQRRLTNNSDYDWSPAWSPDGEWIAFTSNRDGNDEIYIVAASSGEQRRLTHSDRVQDFDPDWSPDGEWIVFTSDHDGDDEIYVMDTNGGNQRQLTNDDATNWWPAWSPDGAKITFASKRDGNWDIYVIAVADPGGPDADSSDQQRLTEDDGWEWWPVWSPDGTRIAFHSNSGGNWDIYVMSAGGKGQRQLTTSEATDQYPAWRPDAVSVE